MKSILGEQDFAAAVRCSQTTCSSSTARCLQAQKILHGRLCQIGERFVLFLSITDVNTSMVDGTELSTGASSIEELADAAAEQAWKLVRGLTAISRPAADD